MIRRRNKTERNTKSTSAAPVVRSLNGVEMPGNVHPANWGGETGRLLARGYGRVYIGLNLETEMMAVKQVATNSDPQELQDLQDEINVMKTLSHEHIVRYLGAQWDDKTRELFIFTEWVPAGSLVDILKKFGRLTETIARTYTHQILLGLTTCIIMMSFI